MLKQHSRQDLVFKIWQNNNTEGELCQCWPPQKRGEGYKRLTIFTCMQSCVPLDPGKFHIVVLVSF